MDNEVLDRYINSLDSKYDEKEKLIVQNIEKTNINIIHTSIHKTYTNAHNILSSIHYANCLLQQKKRYTKKIDDIIKKVLALQQNNPLQDYYGLWPIYLEEPIFEMPNPDFNIASFIQNSLLSIYKNFYDILPKDILYSIESACCAASTFIVNRNCALNTSHIVVLECYCCVLSGELFSHPEFVNYGMQKFESFMHFVLSHGDFMDFNSPTYSYQMAGSLGSILKNIHNSKVLENAEVLNKLLWSSISKHYHHSTGQMAGPYSRSTSDFLDDENKKLIAEATNNKTSYVSENINLSDSLLNISTSICPPKFYPFFSGEKYIEYSQRLISNGTVYPYYTYPLVATTYMRPKYAFGTFNRMELWEEYKPFIAHFGTQSHPYSIKVTCNVNGSSFSSSHLFCLQVKNSALGHVCFSTNRGLYHISDKQYTDGKIKTSDLRIRYQITGPIENLKFKQNDNKLYTFYDDICFIFSYDYYKTDTLKPYIEFTRNKGHSYFDFVLYCGKEKKLNLSDLEHMVCQFSFHISEDEIINSSVKNSLENGYLVSQMQKDDFNMLIKSPAKPTDWVFCFMNNCQMINGILLEDFARNTEEAALQYDFITSSSSKIPINILKNNKNPIDDILEKIERLTSLDFKNLQSECKNIMTLIAKNNISLDMTKRLAIRILTNIFDISKGYSLIFENSLKYEYSNIYINLSQDNSIKSVENTILSVLNKVQLDYQMFSENKKRKDFINSITNIIEKNYQNPTLSLAYIAEKLQMTESHISKTFHKNTGMTYIQYLTRIRMEKAKELMNNGEKNIHNLSEKCGYEYTTSFLRAFKKYTGSTVGTYLKKQ